MGKIVIGQNCIFSSIVAHWDLAGQSFQHKIGVLLVSRFEGSKSFAPSSPKKQCGPKTSDRKTMRTRCQGGFLLGGYQNFCSLPQKLGCVTQKRQFCPKICNFGHFGANIGIVGSVGALLVGRLLVVGPGLLLLLYSIDRRFINSFGIFCYFIVYVSTNLILQIGQVSVEEG